jgi:hypothetical protein
MQPNFMNEPPISIWLPTPPSFRVPPLTADNRGGNMRQRVCASECKGLSFPFAPEARIRDGVKDPSGGGGRGPGTRLKASLCDAHMPKSDMDGNKTSRRKASDKRREQFDHRGSYSSKHLRQKANLLELAAARPHGSQECPTEVTVKYAQSEEKEGRAWRNLFMVGDCVLSRLHGLERHGERLMLRPLQR